MRDGTAQARLDTSLERDATASARDITAQDRDLAAQARDDAAALRDWEADERDAQIARLNASAGHEAPRSGAQIVLRAARDRERAAADRVIAAKHRSEAARDREQAARDRRRAAADRRHAAIEREAAAIDVLTGARRRGPGLEELQWEIDRAQRKNGQLVVAFIDVDGLKVVNDRDGHAAGDALLKRIVGVLRARLRSYDLVVRLGGDEFACVVSAESLADVRRRFGELAAELEGGPDRDSVSVGFAELAPGDSPMDLIGRADADLLADRGSRRAAL